MSIFRSVQDIQKKNREVEAIKMQLKFIVIGDSGGEYEVKLDPISCTCRDYTHRKAPIGAFCKHIKYVLERLKGRNKEGLL